MEGIKDARKQLREILVNGQEMNSQIWATVMLALLDGVVMNWQNYWTCPSRVFYCAFAKWMLPVIFGLIVAAMVGGAVAFQRFGLGVPAP